MSTTVCNAYVQPLAETYLEQLKEVLEEVGFKQDLFLMLSSGRGFHLGNSRSNSPSVWWNRDPRRVP